MRRFLSLSFAVLLILASGISPVVAAGSATQDQVTLTVSVVDQNGDGVGGTIVNAAWDGGTTEETTASNGRAFVDVPQGADVQLQVEDDTYVRNFPVTVNDATNEDVEITVAQQGEASIFVSDRNGALENVAVQLQSDGRVVDEGQTGEAGVFTTRSIEQQSYTLRLSKPGYLINETQLTVNAESQIRSVSMRSASVQITFRVVDSHFDTPQPIQGASVRVPDVGVSNTTDDGRVGFILGVNTEHGITLSKEGYQTKTRRIQVSEDEQTVSLVTRREQSVSVVATNRQVVVGESTVVSVTNAYDEPIAGADVTLDDETVGETDETGDLRLTIPTAGNHTIRAADGSVRSDGTTVVGVQVATETPMPTSTLDATPTDSPAATGNPPTTTTAVSLPGFTPVVAVLGLLLTAFILRRRN
jgi:PGF-CTERM protein